MNPAVSYTAAKSMGLIGSGPVEPRVVFIGLGVAIGFVVVVTVIIWRMDR